MNDDAIADAVRQRRRKATVIVPPLNFALVNEGVYRSGHPLPINYPFLEELGLKMIIYVGDRPAKDNKDYFAWAEANGIELIHYESHSVKEPFVENNPHAITAALHKLVDTRNFPILIHSNKGKHRVGVLVGAMRKMLQGWSLATIFEEYKKFAMGKGDADVEFIEIFEPELRYDKRYKPAWMRTDQDRMAKWKVWYEYDDYDDEDEDDRATITEEK